MSEKNAISDDSTNNVTDNYVVSKITRFLVLFAALKVIILK